MMKKGTSTRAPGKPLMSFLHRTVEVEAEYCFDIDDVLEFIDRATCEEKNAILGKLAEFSATAPGKYFYDILVERVVTSALENYTLRELEQRLS
jgi:hypothetical protein